jgi:hypothetical protein
MSQYSSSAPLIGACLLSSLTIVVPTCRGDRDAAIVPPGPELRNRKTALELRLRTSVIRSKTVTVNGYTECFEQFRNGKSER